jgi:8-oxo-dGTP pyrophosphatase MutT (NUDIX family)
VTRFEVIDRPGATEPARPAATVVLVRDHAGGGVEVLMIKRGSKTAFAGHWAFPGGVIEESDVPPGSEPDPMPAARAAAVREAMEEVGLTIDPASLVFWSHWLPPLNAPRRFSTWFFMAPAGDDHGDHAVDIDGHEVHEHRWVTPREVLALHAAADVELAPPTFITLWQLDRLPDVGTVLAAADPEYFATELRVDGSGQRLCLWFGDVAYPDGDPDASGSRHRVLMHPSGGWEYQRRD